MRYNKLMLLVVFAAAMMFCGCGRQETRVPESGPAAVQGPSAEEIRAQKEKEEASAAAQKRAEAEAAQEKYLAAFKKMRESIMILKAGTIGEDSPTHCRPQERFSTISTIRGVIEWGWFGTDYSPRHREEAISPAELETNGVDIDEIHRLYTKEGAEYMTFLKRSFAKPPAKGGCGSGEGFQDFGNRLFLIQEIHRLQKPYSRQEPIRSGWTEDIYQEKLKLALRDQAIGYLAGRVEGYDVYPYLREYNLTLADLNLTEAQRNKILENEDFAGFGGVERAAKQQ